MLLQRKDTNLFWCRCIISRHESYPTGLAIAYTLIVAMRDGQVNCRNGADTQYIATESKYNFVIFSP